MYPVLYFGEYDDDFGGPAGYRADLCKIGLIGSIPMPSTIAGIAQGECIALPTQGYEFESRCPYQSGGRIA